MVLLSVIGLVLFFKYSSIFDKKAGLNLREGYETKNKIEHPDVIIDSYHNDTDDSVDVFFRYNMDTVFIEKIAGNGLSYIPKSEYKDYYIPSDALGAIQGFFSGIQTIYFIHKTNGLYRVEKGVRYEGDFESKISYQIILDSKYKPYGQSINNHY